MAELDAQVFLWLNGWVGTLPWLDAVVRVVVSDYLIPVLYSMVLLGLWFSAAGRPDRDRIQWGVVVAAISLGIASLGVMVINDHYFRPRPFTQYEEELLFYPPTDSAFPANPVAVVFAMATGVWMANRRLGVLLGVGAAFFAFSRVYAGVFYPLDVIAGALIGVVTAWVIRLTLAIIEPIPTYCMRLVRFLCLA